MKVLHLIAGGDSGGAKTHVLSLLEELNKEQNAALVCLGSGVLSRAAAAAGLEVTVAEGGFLAGLRQVCALSREASVLHCHGSRANLTGALVKGRIPCPVISTVHSDHRLDYLARPLAGAVYGRLNGWALRQMDALVCVSEEMKARYARRGFDPARLYYIYNGRDFDAPLLPRAGREAWLAELGCAVGPEDILCGAAVRLDPVKDLPTLIRGFAAAAEKAPELKLLLAGSGPEEKALRKLVRELGMEGRIFLPGWVEDTERLYAALDVTVLSSLSETFPYAVTDGARYGIPAVATAVGGIPALIAHGETGFLFPPGDGAALAEQLIALTDPALRKEMGERLRTKAAAEFSLRAMAEAQREIYRRVIHREEHR